jgi:NADPH-dependent curcumin reductase CurA
MNWDAVGMTNSQERANELKRKAKFDEVINFKETRHLRQEILKVAPHGIDIVFDTMGGDFLG